MCRAAAATPATATGMNGISTMNQNSANSRAPRPLARRAPDWAVIIATVLFAFSVPTGSAERKNLDAFAKCLTEKNAVMYGVWWCTHCDDQKKLFGDSFQYVHYVECSSPSGQFICRGLHVRYTPTWIFADEERRGGLQSLEQLSNKTGCPLP